MNPGIARDVVNTLRLPSAPDQSIQWNHIPVRNLLDFGLAMTEHDLLGIITTLVTLIATFALILM